MAKILLVEDDQSLREIYGIRLTAEGYEIVPAGDGEQALALAVKEKPDLIISDVMMPKIDGFEMIRRIRKTDKQVPVLFLTARSAINDVVEGFEIGADDYLTKPFEGAELLARVKSLLRRPNVFVASVMTLGNVELNRDTFKMMTSKGQVLLNNKEFQLMEYFMMNSNQVLSTDLIMEKVWGLDSDAEINVVWVNISSLRKKLASIDANVTIKSARGLGYQLMVEA